MARIFKTLIPLSLATFFLWQWLEKDSTPKTENTNQSTRRGPTALAQGSADGSSRKSIDDPSDQRTPAVIPTEVVKENTETMPRNEEPARGEKPSHVPNEVMVVLPMDPITRKQLQHTATQNDRESFINERKRAYETALVQLKDRMETLQLPVEVVSFTSNVGLVHLRVKNNQMDSVLATLNAEGIRSEPNYIIKLGSQPAIQSSDYMFQTGYSFDNKGQVSGTPGHDSRIARAMDAATFRGNTKVAVLDTGVDINHADLNPYLCKNSGEIANNNIDDDGDGYRDNVYGYDFLNGDGNPQDDNGHGTHVAGIIGVAGNDPTGAGSYGKKICVMPLKFLGPDGSGSVSGAVEAINYAIAKGAQVLNHSWGGSVQSEALYQAIKDSYAHNMLHVAAAGNMGRNNDSGPVYPASYELPNIISVGASTPDDRKWSSSNYGARSVHLYAPGSFIFSTYIGNMYAWLSGTSQAAPHVAVAAAILLSVNPGINSLQVKDLILNSVDPVSHFSGKALTSGRLNAYAAVTTGANIAHEPLPVLDSRLENGHGANETSKQNAAACGTVDAVGALNSLKLKDILLHLIVWVAPLFCAAYLRMKHRRRPGAWSRHKNRYNFESNVKLRFEESTGITHLVEGKVANISMGGLGFHADRELELGQKVNVQLEVDQGRWVTLMAEVRWIKAVDGSERIGLEFMGLSRRTQKQIEALVAKLSLLEPTEISASSKAG